MTNIIDAIRVNHTPASDSADYENIIINGEYFGQRHGNIRQSFPSAKMWYIVTSPRALEYHGDLDEYVTNQTVLGVYIDDADYDLTVRQLYIMSKGEYPPF